MRINGNISKLFTCEKGTRQGYSLSPNLFKIFLNYLPQKLNNSLLQVGQRYLACLFYADDVLVLKESVTGQQVAQ